MQMDRSRDKGVAACEGNRAIVRTKATMRTKAKKHQARAIAYGKGNSQDTHFCIRGSQWLTEYYFLGFSKIFLGFSEIV